MLYHSEAKKEFPMCVYDITEVFNLSHKIP